MFTIYPAIDLRGGRCVRLLHGDAARETVYFDNPLVAAKLWRDQGAEWLHVVDLDGALGGAPANLPIVEAIANLGLKVQFGGGMRNPGRIQAALDSGVARVVLGTSAVRDPEMLKTCLATHGDRLAVGIDARGGKVAISGWVETSDEDSLAFARGVAGLGGRTVIHTDIATDGAMTGPNLEAQRAMAGIEGLQVIASGGVARNEDVEALLEIHRDHPNLAGVIIGRAIYEKTVDLGIVIGMAG